VASCVVVHEDGAVGFEDEQADRLAERGREAAGIEDLAAGDEQTPGRSPYCPFRT
jgi:hypothetical protein